MGVAMKHAEQSESVARPRAGLTDARLRSLKPAAKPFKVSDALGLFALVEPSGAILWRVKYRFAGRERLLALGAYRSARGGGVGVTLSEARERRDEARKLLRAGVDPVEHKRDAQAEAQRRASNTFETLARRWIEKNAAAWSESHGERVRAFLGAELFPKIGARPIDAITAAELLAALEPIEERGALETARKTRQYAGQVFDFASRLGLVVGNPAHALRRAMKRSQPQRYRFLTVAELGPFVVKLATYGNASTATALRLAMLCAVRPGEIRGARWQEFDLNAKGGALWRIPAARMKGRKDHLVPLSRQAVEALRAHAAEHGSEPGALLFRSTVSREAPISENTLAFAIRRLGFDATAHGFRHTFSSTMNERGYRADVIERCLAHEGADRIRATYNRAELMPERRDCLQQWADFIDACEREARDGAAPSVELASRVKRVHRQPVEVNPDRAPRQPKQPRTSTPRAAAD